MEDIFVLVLFLNSILLWCTINDSIYIFLQKVFSLFCNIYFQVFFIECWKSTSKFCNIYIYSCQIQGSLKKESALQHHLHHSRRIIVPRDFFIARLSKRVLFACIVVSSRTFITHTFILSPTKCTAMVLCAVCIKKKKQIWKYNNLPSIYDCQHGHCCYSVPWWSKRDQILPFILISLVKSEVLKSGSTLEQAIMLIKYLLLLLQFNHILLTIIQVQGKYMLAVKFWETQGIFMYCLLYCVYRDWIMN